MLSDERSGYDLRRRSSAAMRWLACCLGLCTVLLAAHGDALPHKPSELPSRYQKAPFNKMSLSVGHPNAGWQLRAKRLKKRRYLRVKGGSRNRNYGHPALVKMLRRAARDIARAAPGSVMLVGDLSRKRGGPLSGHRSHQSGRDADVGFYARDAAGKSVKIKRFVAFDGDGKAKDKSGLRFDDKRNWMLVRAWLRDHRARIQYVFVSRPLRQRLLDYARRDKSNAEYIKAAGVLLQQPRNSTPHDDHFHVRIGCPRGQSDICMPNPKL